MKEELSKKNIKKLKINKVIKKILGKNKKMMNERDRCNKQIL